MVDEELIDASQRWGTPLFIYDADIIENRVQILKKAFHSLPNFELLFALKSCGLLGVAAIMQKLDLGIDIASLGELAIASAAGFKSTSISCTSHGLSEYDLTKLIIADIDLVLDSQDQITTLQKILANTRSPRLGLRIDPGINLDVEQPCIGSGGASKLGIPLADAQGLRQAMLQYGIAPRTLHIHLGSQQLSLPALQLVMPELLELVHQWKEIDTINLGGGLKSNLDSPQIEEYLQELCEYVKLLIMPVVQTGRNIKIRLEPGECLINSSGYMLTRILSQKSKNFAVRGYEDKIEYLGVDTSIQLLPGAAQGTAYPIYHIKQNSENNHNKNDRLLFQIAGATNQSIDILAKNRLLNSPKIGDLICFSNVGAYNYCFANQFSGQLRPTVVMYKQGKFYEIRERDSEEMLLSGQRKPSFLE